MRIAGIILVRYIRGPQTFACHYTVTSLYTVITDCLNRVRTLEFGNLHTGLYNSISPSADHAAIESVTFKSGNFMISFSCLVILGPPNLATKLVMQIPSFRFPLKRNKVGTV